MKPTKFIIITLDFCVFLVGELLINGVYFDFYKRLIQAGELERLIIALIVQALVLGLYIFKFWYLTKHVNFTSKYWLLTLIILVGQLYVFMSSYGLQVKMFEELKIQYENAGGAIHKN